MINVGDMLSTVREIMSIAGVILSTVGDTQYRGGYHDACGDIMSTVGVFSIVGDTSGNARMKFYLG